MNRLHDNMRRTHGRTTTRERFRTAGFTLIEVLAALAILGTGAALLLEAHYSALRLFASASEEVTMLSLVERTAGLAQAEVMAGKLSGANDFGKRYPDYSYSFEAHPFYKDVPAGLYELVVTVKGPSETRRLTLSVLDPRGG